jgi:diaminopimelate decarboxylase
VPAAPLDPARDPAARSLLAELGSEHTADLRLGGVAAIDLVREFGSPLYAYDAALLRRRARAVQAALGPRIGLLHSIKANPSLALASILRACGCGAEIASLGELHLALAAGHAAKDLRFAGPGKTDAELHAAVHAGLERFHVESADELLALQQVAAASGRRLEVAVRVNLTQSQRAGRMRMAGSGARFGVDEAEAAALLESCRAQDHVAVIGLHSYAGTQNFDAERFVAGATDLCALAERLRRDTGWPLPELNFGGGFGSPAFVGDPQFDLDAAAAGLAELRAKHDGAGRSFWVELGRYLTGPCGVYLCTVVRKKQSAGRTHLALDGGMHHAAAAAGIGSVLRSAPLLVHATRLQAQADEEVAVGGPLCTPLDRFGDALLLPHSETGDLLAVLGAGAYGLSYSPHSFLSHPTPAEALVEDGKARVIRARGEVQDVLRGQRP